MTAEANFHLDDRVELPKNIDMGMKWWIFYPNFHFFYYFIIEFNVLHIFGCVPDHK